MIRLPGNASTNARRPWRRRVSNQLAAFAAIMLFASTQVTSTQSGDVTPSSGAVDSPVELAVSSQAAESDLERDELTSGTEASSAGSSHKKRKTFQLNLFRLRP